MELKAKNMNYISLLPCLQPEIFFKTCKRYEIPLQIQINISLSAHLSFSLSLHLFTYIHTSSPTPPLPPPPSSVGHYSLIRSKALSVLIPSRAASPSQLLLLTHKHRFVGMLEYDREKWAGSFSVYK